MKTETETETETENEIAFSAADLCKRSAKQILYLREKRKRQKEYFKNNPTASMLKGTEAQLKKSTSTLIEMRGRFVKGKIIVFYSIDEIVQQDSTAVLIEHKNLEADRVVEDWYFESSLVQTAFYHALAVLNKDKKYFTAKFFKRQGYDTRYFNLTDFDLVSKLIFGDTQYTVVNNNPQKFINYYIKKAKATFDYKRAEEYDSKFKFKDFKNLGMYIEYKRNTPCHVVTNAEIQMPS